MVLCGYRSETRCMASDDIQHQFGQRIHDLRKRSGMTQERLAETIGKSVDTISNIERGFTSTRIKTAAGIAKTLGVTLADLFRDNDTSPEGKQRQQAIDRLIEISRDCDKKTLEAIVEAVELVARVAEHPKED